MQFHVESNYRWLRLYLLLAAAFGSPAALPAQGELTRPLELPAEVKPLDDLLRAQLENWFAERDKAEALHGRPSVAWFEANDKFNPILAHGEQLLDYARQHPGTPAALSCLSYIIDWGEGEPEAMYQGAWEELIAHEKDNPALSWLCGRSTNPFSLAANERALKRLLAASTNPRVQASAAFHLAELYDTAATLRPHIEDNRRIFKQVGLLSGLPGLDKLEQRTVEELSAKRTEYLEVVRTKYADQVPWEAQRTFGRLDYEYREDSSAPTLGSRAARLEYALQWLRNGCIAPDLEGTDLAGKTFQLREQRGGPVLIMFSFKGCGACEAFYPDLRQIQQKYAPVGLKVIGVMVDEKVDTVHAAVAAGDITWPCIWDGESGPIAHRYNVESYPTVLLLDGDGRIVSRGRDKIMLERELDAIIKDD